MTKPDLVETVARIIDPTAFEPMTGHVPRQRQADAYTKTRDILALPGLAPASDLQAENERLKLRLLDAHAALRSIAEGNLGDRPGQAGFETIRQVARNALPESQRDAALSEPQHVESCLACDVALKPGDRVIDDISGGTLHLGCAGPERESYANLDTGEPLGPEEPISQGYSWGEATPSEPEEAATGWKLVPVEPTREMWAAMGTAVVRLVQRNNLNHDAISEAVFNAALTAAPLTTEGGE